jgi:outer membrane immunogenic protein
MWKSMSLSSSSQSATTPIKIPQILSGKTTRLILLVFGGLVMTTTSVVAQGGSSQSGSLVDVGVEYNYVRANAPPDGCGCFAMNGGSGWIALNLSHSFGLVGEVASQHASDLFSTSADLTLTSFVAGPRYTWNRHHRFAPFAQALLGGAHASGILAPGNSGLPGSANAFALVAGGGLDIAISRSFALRAFEADYYLTRFDNGVNDHQNNLRIGAGIVIRFGGSR